jgi:hypothetical protein
MKKIKTKKTAIKMLSKSLLPTKMTMKKKTLYNQILSLTMSAKF